MLSERGVWVAYDRLSAELDKANIQPPADAIYLGTYLEDLRDMALAAARAGIKVEPKNSDTDRPEATR